jgi:hypothetical protein
MRIQRVIARAFGPFQNEVLELGPGLSVVAGPNESGKSTWHAALRLAITGVRRGKGPGTLAERQLAERHKPWDLPDRWEVEARLGLDDGRTIDISQDLAGKVACRAVDVAMGRDVSDEIMDGTPDASRWLGLDRDSFAATVSVGQSQIMAVTEAAEGLQEQMQRAAATRGTDATAAEAIAHLEEFRRDAVGADGQESGRRGRGEPGRGQGPARGLPGTKLRGGGGRAARCAGRAAPGRGGGRPRPDAGGGGHRARGPCQGAVRSLPDAARVAGGPR